MTKTLPPEMTPELLQGIMDEVDGPFYLYHEAGIVSSTLALEGLYSWVENYRAGYINFYAGKALPNPHVIRLLGDFGHGMDASSRNELELATQAGMDGERVMFTSNNTPPEDYNLAVTNGAIVNLDDISQIDTLWEGAGGMTDLISFRWNPGTLKRTGTNTIIGDPRYAKFGVPEHDYLKAYRMAIERGATRVGVHAMLASNELDAEVHIETARLVFERASRLSEELGRPIEFVNLGGGLGIPYREGQDPLDYARLAEGVEEAYYQNFGRLGHKVDVYTENGRHVTGPNGYFVTDVTAVNQKFETFVGVRGSATMVMRPVVYDAHHHITVPGAEGRPTKPQAVVGSLCEDNDYFTGTSLKTKFRNLPEMRKGDLVVVHDAGAHCVAMANGYNGKLRPPELILRRDGTVDLVARRQKIDDLNNIFPADSEALALSS